MRTDERILEPAEKLNIIVQDVGQKVHGKIAFGPLDPANIPYTVDFVSRLSFDDFVRIGTELRKAFTKFLETVDEKESRERLREVIHLGKKYFDALFFEFFQVEKSGKTKQDDQDARRRLIDCLVTGPEGTVIVHPDRFFPPWPLMIAASAENDDDLDAARFIGLRNTVIVQAEVVTGGVPSKLGGCRILALQGPHQSMLEEVELIKLTVAARCRGAGGGVFDVNPFGPISTVTPSLTAHMVYAGWSGYDPSMLHVAAHYRPGTSAEAVSDIFQISEEAPLHDAALVEMARRPTSDLSFAFLNACSTASSLFGEDGGVALRMLRHAQCVIATECGVHMALCRCFADAFYKEFLHGRSALQAFSAAREAVVKEDPSFRLHCLAYTLFCKQPEGIAWA